jgi:protocatechuate 3,4-dioxygenase beta subunit
MARWIALLIAATALAAEPVSVRVIDGNGEPVAGVYVNFHPSERNEGSILFVGDMSVTEADGSSRKTIEPGTWDISLFGPIVPLELHKQAITARTRTLEIRVDRGVALSGRVRYSDASAIAKKASVTIEGSSPLQTAVTDASGAFVFEHVPRGKLVLHAQSGGMFAIDGASVDVKAPSSDVALTVPKPGRVEGFVRARDDQQPPYEFTIEIERLEQKRSASFRLTGGKFAIDVPAGPIKLVALANGFSNASVDHIVVTEGNVTKLGDIQLDHVASLTGRVTDPDGVPLKDAEVRLFRDEERVTGAATNERGEYVVEAEGGEYVVEIARDGFFRQRKSIAVSAGQQKRLDAKLERGRELRGRVVDASGLPVAGAKVYVIHRCCAPAESASDGSFVIAGLEDGGYGFRAEKKGYVDNTLHIDVPSDPLRIELARGGVITGTIRNVAPEDRAKLTVEAQKDGMRESGEIDPATGNFRIDSVSDGKVRVIAAIDNNYVHARFANVEVVNGVAGPVDIDMAGGVTITGRVTRDGVPVDGTVGVYTKGAAPMFGQTFSTHGGSYEATHVEKGECLISFRMPDGRNVFGGATTVTGDMTYDIELRGAVITGRVTDKATGAPLAGVEVTIGGAASETQATDRNGMYAFDLVIDGYRTVIVKPAHYVAQAVSIKVEGGRAPVTDLALTPADSAVFRIVDATTGRPIHATIAVFDHENMSVFGDTAKDGVVQAWLVPGTYRVMVQEPQYVKLCDIPLTVPGAETTIALSHGVTVFVRSASKSAFRATLLPRSGSVDCLQFTSSDGKSAAAIMHVAPGEYVLEVEGGRQYPVSVVDGKNATIAIE